MPETDRHFAWRDLAGTELRSRYRIERKPGRAFHRDLADIPRPHFADRARHGAAAREVE